MNVAILASGRGSNAEAVFKRARDGALANARPVCLISDNPQAPALEVARKFGIPCAFIGAQKDGSKGFCRESVSEYISALNSAKAELVVLAGFMRILPPEFIEAFKNRIITLHPSLFPSFKGKNAIKQAYDSGVKVCGCTVHFADNSLDGGKIIAQSAVEIPENCSLENLEKLVHEAEHKLLPQVIADISEGKIKIGDA